MESTPIDKLDQVKFTYTTPMDKGFGNLVGFQNVNVDRASPSPFCATEWERPFGNQSGFVRRSLPCGSFQRSYNSPSYCSPSPFQRASARAVLQNAELSTSTGGTNQSDNSPSATGTYKKLPNPFHMKATSSKKYPFGEISRNLVESQSQDDGFRPMHTSLINTNTSDGLNRIQAELDAIIRQLEIVYPGCSQKSGKFSRLVNLTRNLVYDGSSENCLIIQ